MKKTFVIILVILIMILTIAGYYVYNVRKMASLSKNHNEVYERYTNQEILRNYFN